MITYELAKQLKDAGFPLKYEELSLEYSGNVLHVNGPIINGSFDSIPIPTLSELIESCKGIIIKLWILKDGKSGIQLEGESLTDVIYYSSPEEAIARLWLELNKK